MIYKHRLPGSGSRRTTFTRQLSQSDSIMNYKHSIVVLYTIKRNRVRVPDISQSGSDIGYKHSSDVRHNRVSTQSDTSQSGSNKNYKHLSGHLIRFREILSA